MDKIALETSLKAARECINAALKAVEKSKDENAAIAIYNALECLKSAQEQSK